jgi:heme/copper-type cytochrome/quinol oxidase subunit 2
MKRLLVLAVVLMIVALAAGCVSADDGYFGARDQVREAYGTPITVACVITAGVLIFMLVGAAVFMATRKREADAPWKDDAPSE